MMSTRGGLRLQRLHDPANSPLLRRLRRGRVAFRLSEFVRVASSHPARSCRMYLLSALAGSRIGKSPVASSHSPECGACCAIDFELAAPPRAHVWPRRNGAAW